MKKRVVDFTERELKNQVTKRSELPITRLTFKRIVELGCPLLSGCSTTVFLFKKSAIERDTVYGSDHRP